MRKKQFALALGLIPRGLRAELIPLSVTQWLWPSSIVVGDYLCITGGEQYYSDTDSIVNDNVTYAVDLTHNWTNETIQPAEKVSNPTQQMMPLRQPLLFHDQTSNTVNRWGGWPYDSNDFSTTLWSFQAGSSIDWKQGQNVTSNTSTLISSGPFAAATAYSNSTFFALGGDVREDATSGTGTSMTVLPGLVTYNSSSHVWSNVSTSVFSQTRFRTEARAAFVPKFGAQGVLAAVGGQGPPIGTALYERSDALVDMSEITLYDVASDKWYVQKATGDIPPPRTEFCAVGAESLDGASFELFIYGGTVEDGANKAASSSSGYLNVYALSIPAFRWFKSDSTTQRRRAAHSCSVIGKRQMVSIGGYLVVSDVNLGKEQDPWKSTIGVFDMTQFEWQDHYNASAAPYESPEVVKAFYGDYEEPSWADPALAELFPYKVSTTASNTTGNNSSHDTSASNSTGHTGVIAGSVIGGIAFLSAMAVVFFIFYRQRRKHRRLASSHSAENEESKADKTASPPPGYLPVMQEVDGSLPLQEVGGRGGQKPAELVAQRPIAELPGQEVAGGLASRADEGSMRVHTV